MPAGPFCHRANGKQFSLLAGVQADVRLVECVLSSGAGREVLGHLWNARWQRKTSMKVRGAIYQV